MNLSQPGPIESCADCRVSQPSEMLNLILSREGADGIVDILLCDICCASLDLCDEPTKERLITSWLTKQPSHSQSLIAAIRHPEQAAVV